MRNNNASKKQKVRREPAQAMAEFAIALPVLMLMLVGIFEAGRMIFTYAAVTTAAREASRYASAVGYNEAGTALKYNDCDGIRQAAENAAFFAPVAVDVSYDRGPGDTPQPYCFGSTDNIPLNSGDRVNVSVAANYTPLIRLIPFRSRTFEATSSRTILGIFELGIGTSTVTPMGGGPTRTATVTRAITNTPAGTFTRTSTPTRTLTPGAVFTLTSQTTPTITLLPGDTGTPTDTALPTVTGSISPTASLTITPSFTPTMTPSPTSTSTPVAGCGSLSASGLSISGNLMSMTITNPHEPITIASVQLVWNATTGGPSGKPLIWQTTTVAGQTWSAANGSGNYTSTPGSTITLPGYNQTSTLFIAFDKPYNNAPTNGTTITINFSTVDCSSITRTR